MKLTPAMLKKMIKEEATALLGGKDKPEDVAAKEVDADEFGEDANLEKHVDMLKALKVKEAKLVSALKEVRSRKAKTIELMSK